MKVLINFIRSRSLSTSTCKLKQVPNNLKGKSTSSQQWLTRQLNDPYVEKAKMMNYRCRSAFKLLEMDDRFNFLNPGQVVIDCGAAPGSWTQVAVSRIKNASNTGTVISVDKQQLYPVEGAIMLGNSDFTLPEIQEKVRNLLNGRKADVVLSDMAPNTTGIKEMDDENIIKLCYAVLAFSVQISKVDATAVMKLWQCADLKTLERDISRFYGSVRVVKPNASRSNSAEIFLLARNFKGLKT